jgi:hemolysin activation/secretion protein
MKTKSIVATLLCCTLVVQAQETLDLDSSKTQLEPGSATLEAVLPLPLSEISSDAAPVEVAGAESEAESAPAAETVQQEMAKKDDKNLSPSQMSAEDGGKVVIPALRGVLLLGSSKQVKVSGLDGIEGVQVDNVDLPGSTSSLYKDLSDYWCSPITKQDIIDIKRRVIGYYRMHNRPVIHIQVPPQAVKSGVLQLVVYESRMGDVKAVGNKNFSSKKLEGYIRTKRGDRIKADSLVYDLNWINRNPFRTTDLVFVPSQTEGYTDVELVTKDQFPLRFYAGVDNTGIAQSGHDRWFAGFNWGNCWGLDHIFTYQFTTGNHYNEFWAHSANYTAPLSWRHTLDIYGGYSEVKANLQGTPGVSTKGSSAQASLRYEIPLPPGLSILEEFTWGFDWKRTNTNLLNNDEFFFGKTVNITQLMVGINAGLETARTKNSGTIEVFWSPGQWLPDQQNSHYNDLRAGAKNAYVYGRASVASIFRLPSNFTFEPSLRYQLSSANLLASEQFGLGGYNTVRGYEEREVNGDNAIILNFELRTPPVSLLGLKESWKRSVQDELRFLVFLDYGYAKNHRRYFGERQFQYLMGAGPGLRYVIQKYLTVRVDYGWKLRQIDFGPNPLRHMLYFGVVASI